MIRNLGSSKKGLLTCYLNAPSLHKHKDELKVSISENKIDTLALNETKLNSKTEDEQVSAPGCTL